MVELNTDLTWIPIETPDAEFRIQMFYRQLAEMVVEAGQDGKESPALLPQDSLGQPSQIDHTMNK